MAVRALIRAARARAQGASVLWVAMPSRRYGFLCLLDFADLTIPMLLFHMLTFDPHGSRAMRRSGAT